jgi:hypothetical protein
LKTKVLPADVLVDMHIGWVYLVVAIRGHKHLPTVSVRHSSTVLMGTRTHIVSGEWRPVVHERSGLGQQRRHVFGH